MLTFLSFTFELFDSRINPSTCATNFINISFIAFYHKQFRLTCENNANDSNCNTNTHQKPKSQCELSPFITINIIYINYFTYYSHQY